MRPRKGLVTGLLMVLLLVGGAVAFAQKEQPKAPDPYQNLGLSKDQRSKLDAVTNDRKTAITATQQKIVAIQQKLMALLFDKKASDREIDKVVDQLASADREALRLQVKFHKAVREILTQEQLSSINKSAH